MQGVPNEGDEKKMARYRFDPSTQAVFEQSVVPIGIYQVVDGQVVTLVASDGLCELFGYKDRAEAIERMDDDMYWNVHPDDATRVVEVARDFILEDKPYNLVCRVMRENGYRLIHTRGKHVTTETGERIAVVWYIDEGAVVLDAKVAEDAERIEELQASMHSLLNNMPALSFSKDVETGAYLACNQAFAEYAHRKTPTDVAGLTDGEIFDPVTAAHFVEDDRKALSMDEPYVFFENASDAAGNPRQFQTTKLKFIDETGRLCLLGMSMDVSEVMRAKEESERAAEEGRSYQRLSALNGNLVALYYVDVDSNQYTEFSASGEHEGLGIAKQGADFFEETDKRSLKTVHPEDQALFHAQVTKENMLAAIERDGVFVLDYRLLSGELPTCVRLKAAKLEEDGKGLLIIGLFDEDAQIRQEREYARDLSVARKMATIDSLTGVKNKHAYVQWEQEINAAIEKGEQEPIAAVVCDINGLKAVNDLYGHKEGDACIKRACKKICDTFSHSPVFRMGGDEFVALLTGEDYARRLELMEQINAIPSDRSKIAVGETIAAGMAEYEKRHASLQDVLDEADLAMYERKQSIKESVAAEDVKPGSVPAPEYIPAIDARKNILIVDDLEMNCAIMGDLLEEDYEITYASDGIEALEVLRSRKGEIDLVLLDLLMPNKDGRETLAEMQVDEDLMSIPVVVVTVDQEAELDCLRIGAMDFIPKPYPDVEIVKARIDKCIELAEDRDLIRHTERDGLTGLLNKDYFFRYASRLDHIYKGTALDALACDVNKFYPASKQYGRQFGELVLRAIGANMRKLARKTGGICCRQGVDTFLLYCPQQDDYERLIREFTSEVLAESELADKVSMRFGVFPGAHQEADVEERFTCAKIAADRTKDDSETICGYYDLG